MLRLLKSILALVLLATLASIAIIGIVRWQAAPLIYEDAAAVPARPVAIVFGGGIYADGTLTPILRDRVDTAIQLYRAGKVRKLLMSGDNTRPTHDEPGRMYDYAVAQGIPARDVVRDFAGRRTYDTCYRAGAIFGVHQAVLVTQRFHLDRALYTCRSLGMDAVGFAADRHVYGVEDYYWLRDSFATLAAWLDVVLIHPTPVLGDKVDIGL